MLRVLEHRVIGKLLLIHNVWYRLLACVAVRVGQVEFKAVVELEAFVRLFKSEVVANVVFLANVTTVKNVLKETNMFILNAILVINLDFTYTFASRHGSSSSSCLTSSSCSNSDIKWVGHSSRSHFIKGNRKHS